MKSIMDVPSGIPYNTLERCNYRYLQKLAKSQGLPSNVKKVLLVKMIYAKKYCSPEQVASLIAQIKEQRKLSSKQLKIGQRIKRLQVTKISSTSNPSPPICSTPLRSWSPMPNCSRQTPKTYSNINTFKKRGAESDRVLRSSNSKFNNTNYIKIEKVDIVSVEVNSAREGENQYECNMHMQRYSPQMQLSFKTNNMLPRPRLYDANQRQRETFVTEKQLVPFTSSSILANRERRLSGISPLLPTHIYQPRQQADMSAQEGQLILNAFIQKTIGPQSMLKNKITQTNIKRPIIARNAVQQKSVQMYKSLSNSSTESARESGSDVEMKSRMIRSFQDTFENVAVPKTRLRLMDKHYTTENANTRAEINRADQIEKLQTQKNAQAISCSVDGPKRNFYIIDNRTRGNVSAMENRPKKVIGNRRRANVTATVNRAKMGKTVNKMYAGNQMRTEVAEGCIDKFKELRAYIMIPSKSNVDQQNRHKDNDMPSGVNTVNKNVVENRSSNLNFKTVTESLNYTGNTKSTLEYPNTVNADENISSYPNMSALTDVYPENHVEVISEADNGEVYYHKKIRAEQVRVQRLSLSLERPVTPTLPHITDVFNKLKDPRFQHLTQPLFVDCGSDAATAPTGQPVAPKENPKMPGHLESIYNYLRSGLDQPLDLHHTFRTTSTTTTYTTHLTTTPAVCKSPVPCTTRIDSVQADKPRNSVYLGGLLCLQDDLKMYEQECREAAQRGNPRENVNSGESTYLRDYLKVYERDGEGLTCGEELARSSLSDISTDSGPVSIEDALDVISQDGDYMERIGMGVRMKCVICDWAGPSSILEYHVGLEHPSAVVPRSSPYWSSSVSLASAGRGSRQLSKYGGRIYVVSVACLGTQLRADIVMVPKDDDPAEHTEKCGRITLYNKMTGEPHYWEGIIPTMSEVVTDVKGLKVELADLQLVPNYDLIFANGRWVNASNGEASQIDVNEIAIVVHVHIY